MVVKTYTKLELAQIQLEASIGLFITGRDRCSVITLAGAADVLLSQLLVIKGEENFSEVVATIEAKKGGKKPAKEEIGRYMNDIFFINHMKHFDKGDIDKIEFDPEECALGAISKALVNYTKLKGAKDPMLLAFKIWVKGNLDPNKYNVNFDPNWEREPTQPVT